jgi:xanthine dehydrogenase accessory factor
MTIFERLAQAIHNETPIAIATRLDGKQRGAKLLVDDDGVTGDLGSPGLNAAVEAEARALMQLAQTSLRSFGEDGEPVGDDVRVFVQTFAPKPEMYVFGAIDFSRAMATVGKFMGYRVTVIDARPVFATKARIPDADEIVVAWPDEFLVTAKVDRRTALIVLTHDVKFDVPLLRVALETPAGYIGAMGSRRTHANRIEALREAGIGDAELARIHAPVGLDIGARTPEETAISIAAEIVGVRAGRAGGSLRVGTLPVHGPPPKAAKAAV